MFYMGFTVEIHRKRGYNKRSDKWEFGEYKRKRGFCNEEEKENNAPLQS